MHLTTSGRARLATTTVLLALALATPPAAAQSQTAAPEAATQGEQREVFARSFDERPQADLVVLPLRRGSTPGGHFSYVVTEASTRDAAERLGVNYAPKLANAIGTRAVQAGRFVEGRLRVGAGVDFAPVRRVVPGPDGFPPAVAKAGAVGEPGYTPLVHLPDGTVLNAPHIANASGRADKVAWLSPREGEVAIEETDGFYEGDRVHYISTEASIELAAALENTTYAPALQAAPREGQGEGPGRPQDDEGAREEIGIFTNGVTGRGNPQRQGLSSALLDGVDPLNILDEVPDDRDYSPLWDAHLATWTPEAIGDGQRRRVRDFAAVERLADRGLVTAPDGAAFGPSGFLINCPVISRER